MTTYFDSSLSLEEAKTLYRQLARENHPDMGGDLRTMQEINAQFAAFCASYAKADSRRRQQDAHAENRKSAADFHDMDEVGAYIEMMINFALGLDGVEVELMGLWVWLTGNTKAHKETFKAWNEAHQNSGEDVRPIWKWSPKKTAWYFAAVPSFNRRDTTLDEIRNTYGSQKFTRSQRQEESAGALHA